jgi:hypothetical protein
MPGQKCQQWIIGLHHLCIRLWVQDKMFPHKHCQYRGLNPSVESYKAPRVFFVKLDLCHALWCGCNVVAHYGLKLSVASKLEAEKVRRQEAAVPIAYPTTVWLRVLCEGPAANLSVPLTLPHYERAQALLQITQSVPNHLTTDNRWNNGEYGTQKAWYTDLPI